MLMPQHASVHIYTGLAKALRLPRHKAQETAEAPRSKAALELQRLQVLESSV